MSFNDYTQYDGLGLAELVRNGDVTASELAEAAIERIERRNPDGEKSLEYRFFANALL